MDSEKEITIVDFDKGEDEYTGPLHLKLSSLYKGTIKLRPTYRRHIESSSTVGPTLAERLNAIKK